MGCSHFHHWSGKKKFVKAKTVLTSIHVVSQYLFFFVFVFSLNHRSRMEDELQMLGISVA